MTVKDQRLDRPLKIEVVSWQGGPHCIYLDDFRIAGSKPWGGGSTVLERITTLREISRAVPELQEILGLDYLGNPKETP